MAGEIAIIVFVWGMVAFAVAIDASRRGHHSGFWALLTLFTGVFGATVYVLVALAGSNRTDERTSEGESDSQVIRVCPDCESERDGSQNYCDECGAELGPENEFPVGRRLKAGSRRYCSNCKSEVDREAAVCQSCGAVF